MWYPLVEAWWGRDPLQHGAKAIAREKRPRLPSFAPPARRTPFSPSLSPLPAPFLSDTIHRRGTVTSDLTILPLSPQVQTCLSLEHCSPHKHKDTKSLTSLGPLLPRCHRGMEEAEPESLETYLKFILDTGDSLLHGPLSGLLVYHI